MRTTLAHFLTWRYYISNTHSQPLTMIHRICFGTIALTTFVLTLTLAIIKGFELTIEARMQSIYPPLVIYAPEYEAFDYQQLQKELAKYHNHTIAALSPAHLKQVIISQEKLEPVVITLKGVDPDHEQLVSSIETTLTKKESLSCNLTSQRSIIIGKQLAEHFNVSIGDCITILFSEDTDFTEKQSFRSCNLRITNIMNTGIMHYDYTTALIALKTMKNIFGDDAITLIGIRNSPTISTEALQKKLRLEYPFDVNSWKDMYPALMETLALQKKISWLLIGFIILLSCTTVAALIFMHIQHKWYDFALLKIMGASNTTLSSIILLTTLYITVPSSITGLIMAGITGTLIDRYALISLSDDFIFSHIPVHFTAFHFYGTFILITTVTLLIGLLCSRSTHSINSTALLRFKE